MDIEIKTPNFPDRDLLENFIIPTYLLNDIGRKKLEDFCNNNGINCHLPRALKIKDFMNYAGEKFSDISSENHINLLVIEREKYDIDVMIKGVLKDQAIQFYGTQMLFVAQDRTLKYADLSSGVVKTLAPNAMFNGYDGDEPTSFNWSSTSKGGSTKTTTRTVRAR